MIEEIDIEVDQDEKSKIASSPTVIATSGLGPCFGFIFYHPVAKKALVGHLAHPEFYLVKIFNEVSEQFPDLTGLKVYVGGSEPIQDNAPEFTEEREKRAIVAESLKDMGFEPNQIQTKYLDSGTTGTMIIDTETGEFEYDIQRDDARILTPRDEFEYDIDEDEE